MIRASISSHVWYIFTNYVLIGITKLSMHWLKPYSHTIPPTSQHFTGIYENKHLEDTLPSWPLPSTCILPRYKCHAWLRLDVLCIQGQSPTCITPFNPYPSYSRFSPATRNPYTHQIQSTRSPTVITAGIQDAIHTPLWVVYLILASPGPKPRPSRNNNTSKYLTYIAF